MHTRALVLVLLLRPFLSTRITRTTVLHPLPLFFATRQVWKPKYAELRYGEFLYFDDEPSFGERDDRPFSASPDDDVAGGTPLFAGLKTSHRGGDKEGLKCIPLHADALVCRVLKMRDDGGDSVFELSVKGSARRIWQVPHHPSRTHTHTLSFFYYSRFCVVCTCVV